MSEDAVNYFPEPRDLMVKYIFRHRDRCGRIASLNRIGFRATGILVVLLSAGLPVFAAFEFQFKTVLLTVASLGIAILTGLRGFYKWDEKWRLYRMQEFLLTRLILQWEIEMTRVMTDESIADPEAKRMTALGKTEEIIKSATDHIENEVNVFFGTVSWLEMA